MILGALFLCIALPLAVLYLILWLLYG